MRNALLLLTTSKILVPPPSFLFRPYKDCLFYAAQAFAVVATAFSWVFWYCLVESVGSLVYFFYYSFYRASLAEMYMVTVAAVGSGLFNLGVGLYIAYEWDTGLSWATVVDVGNQTTAVVDVVGNETECVPFGLENYAASLNSVCREDIYVYICFVATFFWLVSGGLVFWFAKYGRYAELEKQYAAVVVESNENENENVEGPSAISPEP